MNKPTKTGIGWGFLSCGFAGTATMCLTGDVLQGAWIMFLASSVWSAMLALSEWQPQDGGE